MFMRACGIEKEKKDPADYTGIDKIIKMNTAEIEFHFSG